MRGKLNWAIPSVDCCEENLLIHLVMPLLLSDFHKAAASGDLVALNIILKAGHNINEQAKQNSFTALHWASLYGQLKSVQWLLWSKIDPSVSSSQGWTPAHIAAINGHHLVLEILNNFGVLLEKLDNHGNSPLHLAVTHGRLNCVLTLLRCGMSHKTQNERGWTPVHTAAFHGRYPCLQALYKWGAYFNSLDKEGNTAVHLAAMEGHVECFRFLVKNLLKTSMSQHPLKARNVVGLTPQMLAEKFYRRNIVECAIEMEANKEKTLCEVHDPPYPAHDAAYQGDLQRLKLLIEQGIYEVDERDKWGSTPAHKAAGQGHEDCLHWLVEKGADLRAVNNAGDTPQDIAVRFAQWKCARLLGVPIDSDEDVILSDEDEQEQSYINNENILQAREVAFARVQDVQRQLEIAIKNLQDLGGETPEDKEKHKNEQVKQKCAELENLLAKERFRREELEAEVDQLKQSLSKSQQKLEKGSKYLSWRNMDMEPQLRKGNSLTYFAQSLNSLHLGDSGITLYTRSRNPNSLEKRCPRRSRKK
ncbi:ankyrin repeat domain-containing protein 42-like isoform X2 [Tachypleus tridentatus]|uniref:ankyrin repeat domain-containing protein 42-like isoform X2 n=1 Tax=Tachypleus tridentatus TaxID=6853 RepID=UPI003FD3223C